MVQIRLRSVNFLSQYSHFKTAYKNVWRYDATKNPTKVTQTSFYIRGYAPFWLLMCIIQQLATCPGLKERGSHNAGYY